MPIVTITSGIYSNAENIVKNIATHTNFQVLTDNDIFLETSRDYDIKMSLLNKIFDNKQLIFNDLIHTRERCIACLKKTVSKYVSQGEWIFHGLLGHLVPSLTTHVIKVLIIANKEAREQIGTNRHGL